MHTTSTTYERTMRQLRNLRGSIIDNLADTLPDPNFTDDEAAAEMAMVAALTTLLANEKHLRPYF